MILTSDIFKTFCNEINGKLTYQCFLTKYKFGHALFKDKMSPLGNVVAFTAPTMIGPLNINNALIVCGEIYNETLFGGVCFQRLFSAQVGSILNTLLKQDSYIDEGSIFVKDKQASITLINKLKEAIGFHIIFSLDPAFDQLYDLSVLSAEQLTQLQTGIVDSFHYITKNIFIETQRDNI